MKRLPSRRVSTGWSISRRLSDRKLKRNAHLDLPGLFRKSSNEDPDDFPRIEEGSAKTVRSLSLPKEVELAVLSIDVFDAVVFMRGGAYMLRYPRLKTRKAQSRLFKVDLDTLTLRWTTPGKSATRTQLELSKVVKIVPGLNSRFWNMRSKRRYRTLGIELLTRRSKIRVQTNDLNEWRHWIRGLCWALHKAQQRRVKVKSSNKAGLLSLKWNELAKAEEVRLEDVLALCNALGLVADRRYIRLLFHKLDEDGSQLVDYGQFNDLVQQLTVCPELLRFASAYINPSDLIDTENFEAFLRDVQNEVPPEAERLVKIIDSLGGLWVADGSLTQAGFCHLLRQDWNSLQNPLKTAHMLTHDMTRPLNEYWIHSCLDPFYSPDSRKSYTTRLADTLMSGVRAFPISIVEGPAGVPLCRPERLTSHKISLADVLATIKQFAFTTSIEPVIILLVKSCSREQSEKLAQLLESFLGDSIYRIDEADASASPPSPEDLRKKFIFAAALKDPDFGQRHVNPGWFGDILTAEFIRQWSGHDSGDAKRLADFIRMPPLHPKHAALLSQYTKPLPHHEARKLDALSRCVALRESHLYHKAPRQRTTFEVHTMNLWKLNATIHETEMAKLLSMTHSKSLGLAYPGGNQLSLANQGVLAALNTGFQFVSISRQAGGLGRSIVECIFEENGCCGYVPKPLSLRSGANQYDPEEAEFDQAITLSITIVSGHQLPRGFVGDSLSRFETNLNRVKLVDWLNPFVVVSIRGIPTDDSTYTSHVVLHDGFHPLWPQARTEFHIERPSLAFLVFEVWHEDGVGNQLIGRNSFRVSSIRSGLRWVGLRDADMKLHPWAGLNVAVKMRAMQSKKALKPVPFHAGPPVKIRQIPF